MSDQEDFDPIGKKPDRCEDCKFFVTDVSYGNNGKGHCHRFPKQGMVHGLLDKYNTWAFPIMDGFFDWCGEFKKNKEVKDDRSA